MIVATEASYKKRGNDPRAYEENLFIRPAGTHGDSLRSSRLSGGDRLSIGMAPRKGT